MIHVFHLEKSFDTSYRSCTKESQRSFRAICHGNIDAIWPLFGMSAYQIWPCHVTLFHRIHFQPIWGLSFLNFLGEHAHISPVNVMGFRIEVDLSTEKSRKSREISSFLKSESPVDIHLWLKEDTLQENHSQHLLKFTHLDPIFRTSGLLWAVFWIFCLLKVLHLCSSSSLSECFYSALVPGKWDPTSALVPYKCKFYVHFKVSEWDVVFVPARNLYCCTAQTARWFALRSHPRLQI